MLIKKPADIKSAEITPKEIYLNRRQFMTSASAAANNRRARRWPASIFYDRLPERTPAKNWPTSKKALIASMKSKIPSKTSLRTTTSTSSASTKATRRRMLNI